MVHKHSSPLVGFNNNVKHKGRIFHVQTEDSGVQRPRIITHLFADGGRIIQSSKTDYSEHLERDDLQSIVRQLMKEQHKAMFIALRDGQFDDVIDTVESTSTRDSVAALRASSEGPAAPPEEAEPARSQAMPTLTDIPVPDVSKISTAEAEQAAAGAQSPVQRRPAPTLADFSIADIGAPPEHSGTQDDGLEADVAAAAEQKGPPAVRPGPPPVKGTPRQGTPALENSRGSSRYGASRPAAIFTEPTPASGSIFGGASISEQSLDEVILSYLAEDLEGPAEKK